MVNFGLDGYTKTPNQRKTFRKKRTMTTQIQKNYEKGIKPKYKLLKVEGVF